MMTKSMISTIGRAIAATMVLLFSFTATSAIAEVLVLDVIAAEPGYNQRDNSPLVAFRLSKDSGRAFSNFTFANVGKKIDLRLDGITVMQVTIREPIYGASGQIIAKSPEDARRIANGLVNKTISFEMEPSR